MTSIVEFYARVAMNYAKIPRVSLVLITGSQRTFSTNALLLFKYA